MNRFMCFALMGIALMFTACGKDEPKPAAMVEQIEQEESAWDESAEGGAEQAADLADEAAPADQESMAGEDAPAEAAAAPGEKININKASKAALESIPGIGPTTAQRIIDYRESSGPFKSTDELKKVKGIGPKAFEKLADHVTVTGGSSGPIAKESGSAPASKPSSGSTSSKKSGGMVNINTASSAQLQSLPGVGPTTADRIVDYRRQNGPFKKPEDLMKIKGIGPKTFEKMKDNVSIK